MKHLRYLNKYLLKYKWRLLLGIVFVALSNYFRAWQPQVIRDALDHVLEQVKLYNSSTPEQQELLYNEIGKALLEFGGLVLLLAIAMGIFMYFMRQTIIVMSRLIEYDLRKEIFEHYERLDLGFFRRNKTGDLMARITEDVSKVRMYLGPAILYGINLTTLFVMVIYSMFRVNVELSLYTLLPLPFLSLSIYYVSNIIHKKSSVIQNQLSRLNSIAQEVYSGIRVVKSYVRERQFARFFADESEDYKTKTLELARVNALFFPLMLVLIGASTILVIYVGGIQVAKGNVTPGNIAEFVIYVNMLTWPVTSIGWIASIIQQAEASQQRINEFLQTKPSIESPAAVARQLDGHIVFDKVSFTYPETGIQALSDVSFEIMPGERVAIVGKTASGKTTVADLLLRMYDVSEGRILLDGEDIRNINLDTLRYQIGYVPQDVFLFSDTIEHNILFGSKNGTPEQAIEYARHASVHDDIIEFPKGYQTLVGERGVTLSGGQKQRVSIARAFVKNPDILILDDCLSAVDTKTEQRILNYLNGALKGKTAIIITHRMMGAMDFDKILVLENGRIAEQGTHEQLMERGGAYYELVKRQAIEDQYAL
ncbi:MAG: ABC transporter ATP-binding protein [Saprospiraceae bacterium]|nr:ABC transporter ATP-binding protein [Saprospiraceae bacterium]